MTIDSAHGFLEEASETMRARARLRDAQGGERSMAKTVSIFNAWTGLDLSEADGWRFMVALKQAREVQGKYNRDDYVDLAAYCGLLGEHESGNRPRPQAEPPLLTGHETQVQYTHTEFVNEYAPQRESLPSVQLTAEAFPARIEAGPARG